MVESNLRDFYFFSFLKDEEIKRLKQISIKKEFYKDEILFYKGEKPKYLHFLVNGIVKLYTHDSKDNEMIIHNFVGPCLIAEIVNFNDGIFPANCSFETKSTMLLIDNEKFKNEFLLKPEIALYFIKSLTNKIKVLENFINYNIGSSSIEKIAKFLYENEKLLPTITQVKIAKLLNITPETLSRKIAKFKKENIIQNNKGHIIIKDYDKLQSYINI